MLLSYAIAFAVCIAATVLSSPPEGQSDTTAAAEKPSGSHLTANLPVDLTPKFEHWKLDRRRQGGRGTCSVFAVTGALEYAVAAANHHGTRLSVEFLNWAGHRANDRHEDGGFFSELWKGYEQYGICPEADLPYRETFADDLQPESRALEEAKKTQHAHLNLEWIKEWDVHTGLTDKEMEAIKRTVSKGWPVCAGLRWPKRAVWTEGVLQMCAPEDVFDGHSILIVGYRDSTEKPGEGIFRIRNSGGDGSDGYLPYEYVRAYTNDAAFISTGAGHR
jgi:C1A family cysteine protease